MDQEKDHVIILCDYLLNRISKKNFSTFLFQKLYLRS